jgi:DNA-binding CsgD family transcriptional regulator
VEHGERALELAGELGDSVLSFWAHWAMAILGGLTGDLTRTTRNLERCHELAEELGSPLLRMWTAEIAIEFAFGEGRWDEGLALGENAISMARALHQPMLLPRLLVWTALIHLGRGDIDRGRAFVDEAWTLSGAETERPASVHIVIAAYIGRAAWHLAIGEYERAIAVAEAGLDVVDRTGYIVWAIHRLLPIAAESALYLRDLDRAAEFGSRLRECSERFDHRLGIAWADACDALTVWLNGDPAAGASLMRRAAEALEAIPFLPDATRLRRQLAGRLAETGDVEGALRELRHVHDMLVELGAGMELDRTRDQFRELGARPPAREPSHGAIGLTGRELEVAQLVAASRSNKAIAAALKISVRTVTTHVQNILRKLEIDSRYEVANVLREAELTGELRS